jgi:hypothetical protein
MHTASGAERSEVAGRGEALPRREVRGKSLEVGDVIEVWWAPRRDTITRLKPYKGPLEYLWKEGAQIAYFAQCTGGMTIDNSDVYMVLTPARSAPVSGK